MALLLGTITALISFRSAFFSYYLLVVSGIRTGKEGKRGLFCKPSSITIRWGFIYGSCYVLRAWRNAGNTTPYADNHHTRHTIHSYSTTTTNLAGPGSRMLEAPTCQGSRDSLVEPSSGPGEAQVSQQLEGLELDDVAQ